MGSTHTGLQQGQRAEGTVNSITRHDHEDYIYTTPTLKEKKIAGLTSLPLVHPSMDSRPGLTFSNRICFMYIRIFFFLIFQAI